MKHAAFVLLFAFAACGPHPAPTPQSTASPVASSSATPDDEVCHPKGVVLCALNPAVTQDTVATTICRSGWTKTVRPPASYTDCLLYTSPSPRD